MRLMMLVLALIGAMVIASVPTTMAHDTLVVWHTHDTLPTEPVVSVSGKVDPHVLCIGDGQSGKRVVVFYARGETQASHYGSTLRTIQAQTALADQNINTSAQQTGGTRHVRWVTTPDCLVDAREIVLPDSYMNQGGSVILPWLQQRSLVNDDRNAIVIMDNPAHCGVATLKFDDTDGPGNANNTGNGLALVGVQCLTAHFISHELGHVLGAVQNSAPHSTGVSYGHCWDEMDNMCQNEGSHPIVLVCPDYANDAFWDCNADDYFNTNPAAGSYLDTHWNVADSPFLSQTAQAARHHDEKRHGSKKGR